MGSCYHPAVSDEGAPTDVSTPNLEAGLPWPLTLGGHGPTNNATGGALEATVWGWGAGGGVDRGGGEGEKQTNREEGQRKEMERQRTGEQWRGRDHKDPGVRGQRVGQRETRERGEISLQRPAVGTPLPPKLQGPRQPGRAHHSAARLSRPCSRAAHHTVGWASSRSSGPHTGR